MKKKRKPTKEEKKKLDPLIKNSTTKSRRKKPEEYSTKKEEAIKNEGIDKDNVIATQKIEIENLNQTVETAARLNRELADKLAEAEGKLSEMETRVAKEMEKEKSLKTGNATKIFLNFLKKHQDKIIAAGLVSGGFVIAGPMGIAAGAAVGVMNYKTNREIERIEKETEEIKRKAIEQGRFKEVKPEGMKKGIFAQIKDFWNSLDDKIVFANGTEWPQSWPKKVVTEEKDGELILKTERMKKPASEAETSDEYKEQLLAAQIRYTEETINKFVNGKINGKEILGLAKDIKRWQDEFGLETIGPVIDKIYTYDEKIRGQMVDAIVEYAISQGMKPEDIQGLNYYFEWNHVGKIETYRWLTGQEPEVRVEGERSKEARRGKIYKLTDGEYEEVKLFLGEGGGGRWNDALFTLYMKIYDDFKNSLPKEYFSGIRAFRVSQNIENNAAKIILFTEENKKKRKKITINLEFNDQNKSINILDILKEDIEESSRKSDDDKKPPDSPEGLTVDTEAVVEKTEKATTAKEELFETVFKKTKIFIDDFKAKRNIERKNYGRDCYDFIIDLAVLEVKNKDRYRDTVGKYIFDNLKVKDKIVLLNYAAEYLRKNNLEKEAQLLIEHVDAFMIDDEYKDYLDDTMDKENLEWLIGIESKMADKQKQ